MSISAQQVIRFIRKTHGITIRGAELEAFQKEEFEKKLEADAPGTFKRYRGLPDSAKSIFRKLRSENPRLILMKTTKSGGHPLRISKAAPSTSSVHFGMLYNDGVFKQKHKGPGGPNGVESRNRCTKEILRTLAPDSREVYDQQEKKLGTAPEIRKRRNGVLSLYLNTEYVGGIDTKIGKFIPRPGSERDARAIELFKKGRTSEEVMAELHIGTHAAADYAKRYSNAL